MSRWVDVGAQWNVRSYPVRVADGRVQVEMPERDR